MTRSLVTLMAAGALFAAASPAPAQSTTPAAQGGSRAALVEGQASVSSTRPFARLFMPRRIEAVPIRWDTSPPDSSRPDSARRFNCLTPVLPAPPTIDRPFEVKPPEGGPRLSMRVVTPACH